MGIPGGAVVKTLPANTGDSETWARSLGREDPLEEGMNLPRSMFSQLHCEQMRFGTACFISVTQHSTWHIVDF